MLLRILEVESSNFTQKLVVLQLIHKLVQVLHTLARGCACTGAAIDGLHPHPVLSVVVMPVGAAADRGAFPQL